MAGSPGIGQHSGVLARLWALADPACRCCHARRSGFASPMLWLIALVVILQSLGLWFLQPLVHLGTDLVSLSALPWLLALAGLWLLSGRMD